MILLLVLALIGILVRATPVRAGQAAEAAGPRARRGPGVGQRAGADRGELGGKTDRVRVRERWRK